MARSKYVLKYREKILKGLPEHEKSADVGHKPLNNLKEAENGRNDWAVYLGGALGTVRKEDIEILRLVRLTRQTSRQTRGAKKRRGASRLR